MPTAKKAAVIDELTDKLGRINAAALIEYRGLTVAEIGALRAQLRQRDVELTVTKNTLLREAAHRNSMNDLDDLFTGPNAVAFIYGDEAMATKALNDYFRTSRVGEIKSGILKGGRRLTAEQFGKLADLPNRQTLLSQIAGLLESPLSQLAALFNAPAQQLAYALANFEEKGGAVAAGVQGAAAPAASPAAPVPEDEALTPFMPSEVESNVTDTEPAGALPIDAAAGEDMGEPPVIPDVAPVETATTVPSLAPEDAEDGTADQIASPRAAETPNTASGGQAVAIPPTTEAPVAPTASTAEPLSALTPAPFTAESATGADPVEITSDEPTGRVVADASQAPESEGSVGAAGSTGSTVRFSAALPTQPISGQQVAEDPTIAPESEGSAS